MRWLLRNMNIFLSRSSSNNRIRRAAAAAAAFSYLVFLSLLRCCVLEPCFECVLHLLLPSAMAAPPPQDKIATAEAESEAIQAWEYSSPDRRVPLSHLHELGVMTWRMDVDNLQNDIAFQSIKRARGYKFSETLTLSPETTEDLEAKLSMFFREHIHSQEEVRVILDGAGYWDVRDYDEKWIRFRVCKGDMIVLPAGMLHRFTLDDSYYIKALLMYTQVPERTHDEELRNSFARKMYVENFLGKIPE